MLYAAEWSYKNVNILNKTEFNNFQDKLFPQSMLKTFSSLHNVIKFKPEEFKLLPKTLLAMWFNVVIRMKM